ncbi:MAG: PD-(D/E)XK nuclease-like domain-containing protein [Candidatus Competibacter sp.]
MDPRNYHTLPGISSHWLIELLKSPAACWRKYLDPNRPIEQPTNALRLGTLVHALALTPHQLERSVIVTEYERRSMAGKKRYTDLQASGLPVIRPAEFEKARAIVAALKANPEARRLLLYGKKERTIVQPRPGGLLPLKARLDVHNENRRQIVELKTTWSLATAQTAMARYRYALSAAFYRDMVRGQHVVFVFVQSTPPYDVAVTPIDSPQLQAGQDQWRTALARFDNCWYSNDWPEAESETLNDNSLMMDLMPTKATLQRFTPIVGELML